jgi:hypothetical protein
MEVKMIDDIRNRHLINRFHEDPVFHQLTMILFNAMKDAQFSISDVVDAGIVAWELEHNRVEAKERNKLPPYVPWNIINKEP